MLSGFLSCFQLSTRGLLCRNSIGWCVMGFLTNVLGLLFLLTASDNQEVVDERHVR